MSGEFLVIFLLGILVGYLTLSTGPEIISAMIDSFMIVIFLLIALLGGVVGIFCKENFFETVFFLNYFFLMILSQEKFNSQLEKIVALFIMFLLGMALMAIIGFINTGVSYLIKVLLEYLFKWETIKIIVITLLLFIALNILWFLLVHVGFSKILDMIDKWNDRL